MLLELTSSSVSLVLVRISDDHAWRLGCPRGRELSAQDTVAAISQLADSLASAIEPQAFDYLMGSKSLVAIFIDAWIAAMAARGVSVEGPSGTISSFKQSFATLATLPPPPPSLTQYRLELATAEDVGALAHLFSAFTAVWPNGGFSVEDARPRMAAAVRFGEVWVHRVNGEIAGFCTTGRATACTIAIRNLYVDPRHRRKGIAEALTMGMLRYYLGARPLGFEGAPDGPPAKGVKQEVCLNVGEDFVERLYTKCGFLFGEDAKDPITGKKAWIPLAICEVKILKE